MDADPDDINNYRPISNLTVFSKLLERLVAKQLLNYLTTTRLLPDLQSAYRANNSTETAILKVLSDILLAVDKGNLAMLTLLDLPAAFDKVDHTILLHASRFRTSASTTSNRVNSSSKFSCKFSIRVNCQTQMFNLK